MELTEEYAKHVLDSVARHFGYDKLDIVNKLDIDNNKMLKSSKCMMRMSRKNKNEYAKDYLVAVTGDNVMNSYSLTCCVKRSYAQTLLKLIECHARVVSLSKMIDFNVSSFKFPDTIEEMCILSDINSAS